MAPNMIPSPNLYKVQSVYNNSVAYMGNYISRLVFSEHKQLY